MVGSVADIYTDFQGVATLKARARADQSGTLGEVARQFESLMLNMMLKSMRQASLGEGVMDSQQSRFYRDMYDQQLALHLAEHGGMGLAQVLERQLGGMLDNPPQPRGPVPEVLNPATAIGMPLQRKAALHRPEPRSIPAAGSVAASPVPPVRAPSSAGGSRAPDAVAENQAPDSPAAFVRRLWPFAREAGAALGLQPEALLAQAALETGWGKRVIRFSNGNSSHNLFGIKADQRWSGDRVMVPTVEYEQDVPVPRRAPFRAYPSFRESFQDYVAFVRSSPRYQEALSTTERPVDYFSALQQAGYATDPRYAEKITRIIDGDEMRAAIQQLKRTNNPPI